MGKVTAIDGETTVDDEGWPEPHVDSKSSIPPITALSPAELKQKEAKKFVDDFTGIDSDGWESFYKDFTVLKEDILLLSAILHVLNGRETLIQNEVGLEEVYTIVNNGVIDLLGYIIPMVSCRKNTGAPVQRPLVVALGGLVGDTTIVNVK